MHKLYIILIFALPALCIGTYASLIQVIDPYGFYSPLDRGAFPIKPAISDNQNMAKAQIVKKTNPDTVIIGSSRVDYGIDPTHPYFKTKNTYNFGLKAIRIPEIKRIIEHAHYSGTQDILWGIDFFSFNMNITQRSDFNTSRLYSEKNTSPDNDLNTLISLSSLRPAIETIQANTGKTSAHTLLNGQHSPEEFNQKEKTKGSRALFDNSVLVFLTQLYFPNPDRDFSFTNHSNETAWKDFEETLKFIKNNNINTDIFIAPQHVQQYILIHQSGLLDTYLNWKIKLQAIAKQYNLTIHDYTTISPVTTEAITNKGENSPKYYWEASHYKPAIGDMILNNLNGKPSSLSAIPISQESAEKFRHDLTRYQCQHPKMTQGIQNKIMNADLQKRLIPPLNCP